MTTMLRVENLCRYFGGLAALKNVNLEVAGGCIYGMIGPNGAGKTTLLSIISGSLNPTSGKVECRGRNITGMKSHQVVKQGIARTHQIVKPLGSLSVLRNVEVGIRFGRRGLSGTAARDAAMELLEMVGLAQHAAAFASTLSIGNQKRLELARALATGPELLLCDELCGGLTSAETQTMLSLLGKIRSGGTTIIYIEHDMKAVMSLCDRILVLNFGQRLAEGPPEEIRNDPAVIEAYLGKSFLKGEMSD